MVRRWRSRRSLNCLFERMTADKMRGRYEYDTWITNNEQREVDMRGRLFMIK
jgi:hypothetical protein